MPPPVPDAALPGGAPPVLPRLHRPAAERGTNHHLLSHACLTAEGLQGWRLLLQQLLLLVVVMVGLMLLLPLLVVAVVLCVPWEGSLPALRLISLMK